MDLRLEGCPLAPPGPIQPSPARPGPTRPGRKAGGPGRPGSGPAPDAWDGRCGRWAGPFWLRPAGSPTGWPDGWVAGCGGGGPLRSPGADSDGERRRAGAAARAAI